MYSPDLIFNMHAVRDINSVVNFEGVFNLDLISDIVQDAKTKLAAVENISFFICGTQPYIWSHH